MPWFPEQFSAKFLASLQPESNGGAVAAVPYFDGVLSGDIRALVDSFAGAPELHHPTQGRVQGEEAFSRFISAEGDKLRSAHAVATPVNVVVTPHRAVEEVVLAFDGVAGRIELPVAVVADLDRGRINELRVYFSSWPERGAHAVRPPVLQSDPAMHLAGVVGEYQRALAQGSLEAVIRAFEPGATVREPAGREFVHAGAEELRALYELFFSNGGGVPLEHCTFTDDGHACAIEYNVVRWGRTDVPPQAGVAVYVRGESGRIAHARIYDDVDPPVGR
ncbi:MAG: hypothetical protein K0Q52_5 [Microbacterium sp.]|jgi:hypothetical protein|nr:hypothetical protein [Microbacterium sp.]